MFNDDLLKLAAARIVKQEMEKNAQVPWGLIAQVAAQVLPSVIQAGSKMFQGGAGGGGGGGGGGSDPLMGVLGAIFPPLGIANAIKGLIQPQQQQQQGAAQATAQAAQRTGGSMYDMMERMMEMQMMQKMMGTMFQPSAPAASTAMGASASPGRPSPTPTGPVYAGGNRFGGTPWAHPVAFGGKKLDPAFLKKMGW